MTVVSTTASFEASAKRIREFRLQCEAKLPGVNVALLIAEEIKTDVAASRPGAGVPRETGALASTLLAEGHGTGLVAEATLSAGGAAAPYALIQHERMDYHHVLGEARYLVRGVERWRAEGSAAKAALDQNVRAAITKAKG